MSSLNLRLSMAPHQILNHICDEDPEIQEVGLRNATELATTDEGISFLKTLKLIPQITNLLDSDNQKVRMLSNWCVANMTSKDEEVRLLFLESGVVPKVKSSLKKSLSKEMKPEEGDLSASKDNSCVKIILSCLVNLSQNASLCEALVRAGIFEDLCESVERLGDPSQIAEFLLPIVNLLKCQSNPQFIQDSFVSCSGITCLMKILFKLSGNLSGSLKSSDYELLRHILLAFYFLSLDSPLAKVELVSQGLLGIVTTISGLILPPDIGAHSILLQTINNLSCHDPNEIPILESDFLLVAVDFLGSVSEELRYRSCMLLANMSLNPRVRASMTHFGWNSHILNLIKLPFIDIQRQAIRFVINISANSACRKLLLDARVLNHLESMSPIEIEGANLANLVKMAIANLKVPVDVADVEEEFKVETAEVVLEPSAGNEGDSNNDIDSKSHDASSSVGASQSSTGPQQASSKASGISMTSTQIDDPFQLLDKELKSYFGASIVEEAAPLRGRTATMTKDPKDEPTYIRRERIAREIFDTEEKYVANLRLLLEVFIKPLRLAIAEGHPILSPEEMNTVFSVVELIHNLHVGFLAKLRPLFEKWTWSSCIGSLFETLADRLKVYETFVNNYDRALAFLDSPALVKRKNFQAFMKEAASKAKEIGYAGISHYLIMPIQRPPRFLMLLGELVKYTPNYHVDLPHLKRSVTKMQALASYLNEARRVSESQAKAEEIQQRFGGPLVFQLQTFNIAEPGRVFIKDGSVLEDRSHLPKQNYRDTISLGSGNKRDSLLFANSNPDMSSAALNVGAVDAAINGQVESIIKYSVSGKEKRQKRTPRYVFLFLFNDTLLIASMVKKMLRQSTLNAKLKLVNVLPLSQVEALDPMPDPKVWKFQLKLKDDAFPLVFVADTELEKGEWIQAINTALKSCQAKQNENSQISEIDKLIELI